VRYGDSAGTTRETASSGGPRKKVWAYRFLCFNWPKAEMCHCAARNNTAHYNSNVTFPQATPTHHLKEIC